MGNARKKFPPMPKCLEARSETEASYALLAERAIPKKSTIVFDLRISRMFASYLRDKGFKPIPGVPGKGCLKKTAREKRASAAVGLEGKFYLRKSNYRAASQKKLRAMVREITPEELRRAEKIFKKRFKSKPFYFKQSGEFNAIAAALKKRYRRGATFFYGKGLLIEFSNWWFNILYYEKENMVEIIVESNQKQKLSKKATEIKKALEEIKPN